MVNGMTCTLEQDWGLFESTASIWKACWGLACKLEFPKSSYHIKRYSYKVPA